MKANYINGVLVRKSGPIDAATIGTDMLTQAPRFVEVTASNTYRVYSAPNKYRSKYMYKGIEYDGESIFCVTDSGGTALTAGICYYVY